VPAPSTGAWIQEREAQVVGAYELVAQLCERGPGGTAWTKSLAGRSERIDGEPICSTRPSLSHDLVGDLESSSWYGVTKTVSRAPRRAAGRSQSRVPLRTLASRAPPERLFKQQTRWVRRQCPRARDCDGDVNRTVARAAGRELLEVHEGEQPSPRRALIRLAGGWPDLQFRTHIAPHMRCL